MMKALEKSNELQNGNQFFFLASTLLGVVCYSNGNFEQAHLFFSGTMNKQLRYVEEEKDHPFLEQTFMHLALLYKALRRIQESLGMWELLLGVHKRTYGDKQYYLASDFKNIGTCLLGLNNPEEAIENFLKAELYCKEAIETENLSEDEIKEERVNLATVYFSIYLAYMALEKLDLALFYNEKSYEVNILIYGPDDLNVANNYYLGAQIYMKLLKMEEAVQSVEKCNEIMDKKEIKNPLLFGRY
jgi:tetratricopeptide (TPR) repeat protein